MSIQHLAAVLYHMPELTSRGDAMALMAIADSADRETGFTHWKTIGAIARAARLHLRNARCAVRILEREGYIRTQYRGPEGRQGVRWRVLFDEHGARRDELLLYPQPPGATPGVKRPPPGVAPSPPGVAPSPPGVAPSPYMKDIPIHPSPSLSKEGALKKRGKPKAEKAPQLDRLEQLERLKKLAP